jgi:outer membrane protein assembly factor BamE (lipoprotein component of BamABCDE complex)
MVRAFILAALLLASACSPIVSVRGHNEAVQDFSQIIVGQSRPEDVQALLGSPSSRSNFGDETWYYISTTEEARGMFAPKITAQHVTSVRFDTNQLVAELSQYEMKDGKPVALVRRETPTEGHELTFIEQMLGNVGRINAPGGGLGQSTGRAGRR